MHRTIPDWLIERRMLAGLLPQNLAYGARGIIAGVDPLLAYRAIILRIPNIQNAAPHVVVTLHNLARIVIIQALARLHDDAARLRGSLGLRRGLRGRREFRGFDRRLLVPRP